MHRAWPRASGPAACPPLAEEEELQLEQERHSAQATLRQPGGPEDAEGDARQLAVAVEDKLKLAPILAKRLERVSHSSGSFSSRQSVTIVNAAHPSGRNTPQRRTSGSQYHNDYGKLNYLVTSLEGRGERNLKVEGSARLPQVSAREPSGSPTTSSRSGTSHSFDDAKRHVDRDLRLFLEDVRELYNQISQREGADVPIVLEVIASIMDIAEECLETPIEDFKLTITDIVDNIEEERSACQQRTIRALYTRMLFILTRCSRLLITEQQHLFATEPRNRRRHSQVFGPGFTTKTQKELGLHLPPQGSMQPEPTTPTPKPEEEEEEEPVFRSHTMPVKAMYSMVQQLKKERPGMPPPGIAKATWAEGSEYYRSTSQVLDSPAPGPASTALPSERGEPTAAAAVGAVAATGPSGTATASEFAVLRHASQSSDLEGYGGPNSDSSMSGSVAGGLGGKKKKTLFGKISKGFKNLADGFKRKSTGLKDKDSPDGLTRPHSEMLQQTQHVRFRVPSDVPQKGATSSPGGSRRGTLSGLPGPDGAPSPSRRLDQQRSVRFQETPVIILGEGPSRPASTTGLRPAGATPGTSSGGAGAGGEAGVGVSSGSGSGAGVMSLDGTSSAGDTGKRAKLMVNTNLDTGPDLGTVCPVGPGHAHPHTHTHTHALPPRESVEGGRSSASPMVSSELDALGGGGRRPGLFRRASVDLYAYGHGAGYEPMSPDGTPPPDDLEVICSICEEAWLSTALEEHSIHCAVLRTLSGNGLSVDAQLTTIANVLEEWLETPMAFPALGPAPSQYHTKTQLMRLIKAARNAAALQPDGSKVPTTRCFSLEGEVHEMLQQAADSGKLAVVTQTYAHRVMRLVMEKVSLLAEPFGGPRQRGVGSDTGDSGTSTPRSMPGMSIEEFEIIKPISRGAFGRVYLARKLATGDLFAIKVMKKRDLIRKNMVESVNNERNILAMAQNPFVVRFYYSFTSRENLYIVMEYINGGDCYSLLRKFGALDEEVARQYIAETVLALEYCHAQGIIHRDLKPDNLLINAQGHVKLTDFGLSCLGVIDRTDNLNGSQPMDTDGPGEDGDSGWGPTSEANAEFSGSGGMGGDPMDASGSGVGSGPAPLEPPSGPVSDGVLQRGPAAGGSASHSHSHTRLSASGQGYGGSGSQRGLPPRPAGQPSAPGGPGATPGQHQRIVAPEHEAKRAVGTPDYLAPELLLGTGHGPEVDWWALGAILYEFVTGTPPFNADSPEEIFDNILDRRITWPDEDDMSPECRDLIDKLLHPNPLKRLGHRGAGEVKLHPWFEGLDWTGLVRNKAAFIPTVEDETDTSYFETKAVSQRSMAEDLDKVRTSATGGGQSGALSAGQPTVAPSGTVTVPSGPSSGPASVMGGGGGRTAVDRLKDQYHRESSGVRSGGSSNSHVSHMSRTSCTGNSLAAGTVCSGGHGPGSTSAGPDSMESSRVSSSPFHPFIPGGGPGPGPGEGPVTGRLPHGGSVGHVHHRSSVGSSCGVTQQHSGLRGNSGSGARGNSASGARYSGSGVRGSGSGTDPGGGPMSDRPSPASGGATVSGNATTYEDDERGGEEHVGNLHDDEEYDDDPGPYDRVDGEAGEDVRQCEELPGGLVGLVGPDGVPLREVDELDRDSGSGGGGSSGRTGSGSGGDEGDDSLPLNTEHDPFNNFSFTNYTGLSAANMEKILKLREQLNRRTSYSGPGM